MIKNNQKIPEGWSVKKILDVCPLQRGFDLPEQNIVAGDYPIVYSNGIKGAHNEYKAKAPGVVTGRSGTIGKVTYVEKDYWPHNTSLWVTDFKGNNPKFIFYKIQNLKFEKFNSGSGVPTLNRNDVHVEKILLPPLPEQEKIAGILGTWDEVIEKLSTLIEKKKLLKKGLMQKLLTGKHRLNGFTQPWKEVKLGEILFSISKRNKDLTIKRVLSVTNSRGFVLPEEQFARSVASEDLSNYKIVKKGEFAYNPSRLNVGSIDRLDNFENGVLSPMYVIFKCGDKINSDYMKHWIDTAEFNTKVRNSAQGSVRETVDFKTLSTIKICLPSDINEQQAIANVLSTADEEIDLLNKKLEALKEQKKGLMQQLLTGQTRVKVN